jgi:hypothetical protein
VTFWDKIYHVYKEIDSDSTLLATFDMYWQIRRLPLTIAVIDQPISESDSGTQCSSHAGSKLTMNAKLPDVVVESQQLDNSNPPPNSDEPSSEPANPADDRTPDPWGENAEVEYVGIDDEKDFHSDLVSDE